MAKIRWQRFLLKDPFALFNVAWLEKHYGVKTILLIRHPAAFVASLKVKKWTFDFKQWSDQPSLMAGPLAPFEKEILKVAQTSPDIIDQGCLLWKVINHQIQQLAKDPNRILLHHEDLLQYPEQKFKELFKQLNLTWTKQSEQFLKAPQGLPQRKPEDIIDNWKQRLSKEEVSRVRKMAHPYERF
jgi:hypothetical protein